MQLDSAEIGSLPLTDLVQRLAKQRNDARRDMFAAQAASKPETKKPIKSTTSDAGAAEAAHAQSLIALAAVRSGRAVSAGALQSNSSNLIKSVETELKSINTGVGSLPSFASLSALAPFEHADELEQGGATTESPGTVTDSDGPPAAFQTNRYLLHENLESDQATDPLNRLQFDSLEQLQAYVAAQSAADISSATAQAAAQLTRASQRNKALQEDESFDVELPIGRLAGRLHALAGDAPSADALVGNFTNNTSTCDAASGDGSASSDDEGESGVSSGYMPWQPRPPAAPGSHDWVLPAASPATHLSVQPAAGAADGPPEGNAEEDEEEEIQVLDAAALAASDHTDGPTQAES